MKKLTKIEALCLTDDKLDSVVKIQGTQYDRKRKISPETVKKMMKLSSSGKSISEIADKLGISYTGVRYNIDPQWRATYNATRDGKHTGKDHITVKDRVAYKRNLVAQGKLTAMV